MAVLLGGYEKALTIAFALIKTVFDSVRLEISGIHCGVKGPCAKLFIGTGSLQYAVIASSLGGLACKLRARQRAKLERGAGR